MRTERENIHERTAGTDTPQTDRFPTRHQYGEVMVNQMAGMNLNAPRPGLKEGQVIIAQNARVRDYWLGRRPGTRRYTNPPTTDPIIGLCTFYRRDARIYIIAVSPTRVYARETTEGEWIEMTGTMRGHVSQVVFAHFVDDLYFANDVDQIHRVSLESMEVTELVESPRARFITSFGDRLVAAYNGYDERGVFSTNVAWCANSNPFIWKTQRQEGDSDRKAVERETAGEENLIQSPTDTGDEITGLVGLDEVCVIVRERSIWEAVRQPIGIAPFRFRSVVSNFGSDLPYSVVRGLASSVIFADTRTNGVYSYSPAGGLERLGDAVSRPGHGFEESLFSEITSRYWTEGAFDPFEKEYHLLVA